MMLCMYTKRYNAILLINITDHDLNLNSDSNTKIKTKNQRDKDIYVETILFDAFEFFIVETESFIDVEN